MRHSEYVSIAATQFNETRIGGWFMFLASTCPKRIPAFLLGLIWVASADVNAQPQPGDLFREYLWTNSDGDAGGSLRVGGKVGYDGGPIAFPHRLDLAHATRAEVVVEKLLCHDGTRGLALSINGNDWIVLPEAKGIPSPPWNYQHHTYPVVDVPLDQLNAGLDNQFRMRVSDEHPWSWPQNLIYGVHFRVYYDKAKKAHPTGRVTSPTSGSVLQTKTELRVEAASPNGDIRRVDFLGAYEDVNMEGDGRYTQWHYRFVRAELQGHIGSVFQSPWKRTWDTSWVPDQARPFQLAARITDDSGLVYVTPAIDGLRFDRGGLSVELCKPFDVPEKWVTRRGEQSQKFQINGNLTEAVAAQLVWSSWSPGYMEGLYINDRKVFDKEGPRYACYVHRVPLMDLSVLRPGENLLKTGKTPKYNGKMVHGMEVNWPGIMVLIQYQQKVNPDLGSPDRG